MGYRLALALALFLTLAFSSAALAESTQSNEIYEQQVQIGSGPQPLKGILTMPKNAEHVPCVVLVHGLGALDRDLTLGPNKPFKQIAEGLAAHGIAVLRYDKRNFAYPGCVFQPGFDINQETLIDATDAVDLIANDENIDHSRIFVAGHCMGGLLTCELANRIPELAGVIILSSPGKSLEDVYAGMNAVQQATVKAMWVPRCWQQVKDINAPQQTAEVEKRFFVAQGGTDGYVPMDKGFDAWQDAVQSRVAGSNVSVSLYPGMNHALLELADEGATLTQNGQVPPQLLSDLSNWIHTSTTEIALGARP